MSLLKVSLCINRPKQRLLCMDTRRGCRSRRLPTPWKNKKKIFRCMGGLFAPFFHGEGFILRFSSDEGFFHRMEAFLLLSLYVGGLFGYVFLLVWGIFRNVGALFAIIFSMWGFYVLMGFLWACPFPLQFILRAHAIM